MKEIQNGLFALEEEMPCPPRDINVYQYFLAIVSDQIHWEEAGARIILFSKDVDQWVGVSWPRIFDVVQKDMDLHAKWWEIQRHNQEEGFRVARAQMLYRLLSILTFGILKRFLRRPGAHLMSQTVQAVPLSTYFIYNPEVILENLQGLIQQGFIRCVKDGEGEDAVDVYCPTPAFVSHIMEKQRMRMS